MSYDLERRLIETRFKAGMPVNAPIQYGNTDFAPPSTGFIRITVLSGGGSGLLAITGGSQRRYSGVIDVALFVPHNDGTKNLRARADEVEVALAHQSLVEGSTRIITFGADFVEVGKAGDWYQGNVTIKFQRDQA